MVTMGDPALKQRIDSERNQGRAPDMGWLDHDRLGFNYRLSDLASAIGLAQLERLDEMLADRARVAASYREALGGDRGICSCPCPDADGNRRGWFVFVVQLPREVDRDETVRTLRERHEIPSKPYFPAVHLMSYYREQLRPSRGRVPGVRGRRRTLDRAAVLSGDDREPGRPRGRRARRRPRALGRVATRPP